MNPRDDALLPNGTFKNKIHITDQKELQELEYRVTKLKYRTIPNYTITDIDALKKIHEWLFSDLYPWAGQYRTINLSKGATSFMPYELFHEAIPYLNKQIKNLNTTNYPSARLFATDLGQLLTDINHFHPFREGNGRTQRLFITLLAIQSGYEMHFAQSSPAYDLYMKASIEDSAELMAKAVLDSLKI